MYFSFIQVFSLKNQEETGTDNQKREIFQINIDKLNREKCGLISCLNYLKQKIQDIEMRQNEAIRDVNIYFYFFSLFII